MRYDNLNLKRYQQKISLNIKSNKMITPAYLNSIKLVLRQFIFKITQNKNEQSIVFV